MAAYTTDPALIRAARASLQRPRADRRLFINGRITRGTKGNLQWSWHFVPDAWSLTEVSTEVCDGRPRMVEANRAYWIDTVGRFCPWGARVVAEWPPVADS